MKFKEAKIYAIITSGGKQYKVEENQDVVVDYIQGKEGDKVSIQEVNLISDGKNIKVGNPVVSSAQVEATIKEHIRADKVIAFKFKAKKRYKRKIGHRQPLTVLHTEKIKVK